MALLVSNVREPEGDPKESLSAILGVSPKEITEVEVLLRALDARPKVPVWRINYRVEVKGGDEGVLRRHPRGVRPFNPRDRMRREGPADRKVRWEKDTPVVVVGAGPAGLFAALRLAEGGVPVVLLERGGPVEARVGAVNGHWRGSRALDPENNILFGEGGAGTFSDGKIYTRRRDGELGYIFRVLVEAGADPEILDTAYAHLGTDKVRAILPALRERLRAAGVDVRFGTRLEGIETDGQGVSAALLSGEGAPGGARIATRHLFVAAGHSARDTFSTLLSAGAAATLRPIAIGARIEHPQALVDRGRYGTVQPDGTRGDLPPASYRLAWNPPGGRSAYTFCMCPGGMVVPAAHQDGQVVVNGMSFAARRAMWANSAVIVQVHPEDYGGDDPLAGVRFQDRIEALAFRMGGGTGAAPAQKVPDFLADRPSSDLPRTSFPMGVTPAALGQLLPAVVVEGMKGAIRAFDAEIQGFAGEEGVLIAPETRTTAPLRFHRGDDLQSNLRGLYPLGEGAGYAGGIISAALDGFRAAEVVLG